MISQLIAMRLMTSVEHVKQLRRQELTPRRNLVLEVLEQSVPSWSWRRPKGGLFVWVHLPDGDARDLAQEALHRGVIVTPGITLSVDGSHTGWLRIPFLLSPDRLQLGLERLIEAWESYSKGIHSPMP
jgi:DNA-binding transcriptional MocR family regulator